MPVFDLFSKRQKKLRGEYSDVYAYDNIPQKLRVQIVHIIRDCIGTSKYHYDNHPKQAYDFIFNILCKEYGKFYLLDDYSSNRDSQEEILNFILQTKKTDELLDVIELTFKYINIIIKESYQDYIYYTDVKIGPDEAIAELNIRFKECAIGYSFEGNEIMKIDSTYTHSEITKPTISLLNNRKFEGANEEYLKAHEHYRHGRNKECLVECLKTFESTMKVICAEKKWPFKNNNTSSQLIQICFDNGLVPAFTQNQFTSLKSLLESGIPSIRNNLGGHGQGQIPQKVDDEMTRYALNLTGANIIFLIEQSKVK